MRPLIISDAIRDDIRKLKEKAAANPVVIKKVMESAVHPKDELSVKFNEREGKLELVADWIWIPHGYRVAYSIEEQPAGMCAHLSISVTAKGKLPNPAAIEAIAKEFGIDIDKDKITGWVEEFEPGHEAVNIVCLIGEGREGTA